MRNTIRAAVAVLGLCLPASAYAQYGVMPSVIGATVGNAVAAGQERACLSGEAPSEKGFDEVRATTLATMSAYVRAAGSAAPADATASFTVKTKLREWRRNGQTGSVSAVDDGFARALTATGGTFPAPNALIRSGDRSAALAVWHLTPEHHYRALFRRESQTWRLQRLELIEGNDDAAAVTQFCHAPGDVEQFKLDLAKYEAERAAKKARKEAARASR